MNPALIAVVTELAKELIDIGEKAYADSKASKAELAKSIREAHERAQAKLATLDEEIAAGDAEAEARLAAPAPRWSPTGPSATPSGGEDKK